MHYNTLFQDRNLKNFLGRAQSLPRLLPTGEGETAPQTPPLPLGAYGASIVVPSALHTSRFRRLVLCVPYFQCRLLATLTQLWLMSSRVNEVNDENLQDPHPQSKILATPMTP